jgi:hypothetical protein
VASYHADLCSVVHGKTVNGVAIPRGPNSTPKPVREEENRTTMDVSVGLQSKLSGFTIVKLGAVCSHIPPMQWNCALRTCKSTPSSPATPGAP